MKAFTSLQERFASEGLSKALDAIPLSAYLDTEDVRDWIVMSDMKVDPSAGVQVILTAAIVTDRLLLVVNVTPNPEDTAETHAAVRVIPLRSIIEVRSVCSTPGDGTVDKATAEFVTPEMGGITLDTGVCAQPTVDGVHVDPTEVDYEDPDVELCMSPDLLTGEIVMNSIVFVEQEGMSGAGAATDLMRFTASVATLAAQI